jgi:heat shock protein HslJ
MRSFLFGLATFATVVMLAPACGDDGDDAATTTDAERSTTTAAQSGPLAGTAWILRSWSDGGTLADAGTDRPATLSFGTEGNLAGSTGCNNFAGGWTEDGDQLTLQLGPITEMACEDPAVQAQEQALVGLLPTVAGYDLGAEELQLTDSRGTVVAVYAAQPTDLAGTSWTATGVNNGKGGLESNELTGALTAQFDEDGAFSGSGGCNRLTGSWESDGDELRITDVASTKRSCDQEVMDLEAQYVAALEAVRTYEWSGDTLTVRDDEGAMQATFTPLEG